ncbi:hypothetical protein DFH08DRAFT_1020875 [Mycena albidolilacea]|uniref:Uncharacterized protein n=1 Tax=Mycena albidolilacea TaxID=1033008 RepID=A0AAD6ZQR1_9AGAR|nr:hypothetical protein DFH08DRAFT_1020875 [Mycena albidolilacea]
MHLKAPFVDSSSRTFFTNLKLKCHTHLRSSSTSSLQKSPPTCTVSLASVTADLTVSLELPATINFPLSAPRSSCVPLPTDADASCGDPSPAPEAWPGPRTCTLSLESPRRAYPPKLRGWRCCCCAGSKAVVSWARSLPAYILDCDVELKLALPPTLLFNCVRSGLPHWAETGVTYVLCAGLPLSDAKSRAFVNACLRDPKLMVLVEPGLDPEQAVRPGHVASLPGQNPLEQLECEPFVLTSPCLSSARTTNYLPLLRSRPCLHLSSRALYHVEAPARISLRLQHRLDVASSGAALPTYLCLHHKFQAHTHANNPTIHILLDFHASHGLYASNVYL